MRRLSPLCLLALWGCHWIFPYDGSAGAADARHGDQLAERRSPDRLVKLDAPPWISVVELDASATSCPPPWVFNTAANGCTIIEPLSCVNSNPDGNVVQVRFSPPKVPYQEIRGFVMGVQWYSTDAFNVATQDEPELDTAYVEGVSITVGTPRRHVWTFVSGLYANRKGSGSCPCMDGVPPPSFVGSSWTCDSGNYADYERKWYAAQPLWGTKALCTTPGWFEVKLQAPTTDPIDVRILFDDCDENIAIRQLKLLVR